MPVAVIEDQPWQDATRWNDSAPWQGGSMLNVGGNACSSSFAAVTPSGAGRLISAAHCTTGTGAVVRDGSGERIGVVSNRAPAYDAILIDPDATTVGKVFGGPWNAGTGHDRYQRWVAGSAAPAEDQRVCTSGAVSGEHCNLLITETSVERLCIGGTVSCSGFIMRNTGGGVTMAVGDSGGPVYIERDDGTFGARGVISQGNTSVDCEATAVATTCYNRAFAIGIHKIEDRFVVTVEQ